MSATHAQHGSTDQSGRLERAARDASSRRADLDHDLVAVLAMLAILALTAALLPRSHRAPPLTARPPGPWHRRRPALRFGSRGPTWPRP